jgi:indoleacetamide hydrolase
MDYDAALRVHRPRLQALYADYFAAQRLDAMLFPTTIAPAGLTASGLPVGLELDGPLGSDVRLLGIGLSVEALLGPVPAPRL